MVCTTLTSVRANMDKIFKIGVLVLGILFLILFFQSLNKERYVYMSANYLDTSNFNILDTRTGHVYVVDNLHNWADFDTLKGKAVLRDLEIEDIEPKK
jgi:hypothetical protein